MAFDGSTIANIVSELEKNLSGGRIYKIAQPENDELLLTIKNNGAQYRLLLSADASLPLVYLTQTNKPGPMTAPGFCMLLRKHLQNARILSITQPGLERIIPVFRRSTRKVPTFSFSYFIHIFPGTSLLPIFTAYFQCPFWAFFI